MPGARHRSPRPECGERSLGTNPNFAGGFNGDCIGLVIGRDRVAHPTWTDIRDPEEFLLGQNVRTRRIRL